MAKKTEKKVSKKVVDVKQEIVEIDGEKKIKITSGDEVKIYGL